MKVVITGPESTGKSWLCQNLAKHYNIPYVEEYARMYLAQTNGQYKEEDLLKIADGQTTLEKQIIDQSPGLVLCDTGLEVIRVWSEWKYGHCNKKIIDNSFKYKPDLFLLMKPDVPWFPDPFRENPDDRDTLFKKYQEVLKEYEVKVIEIGDYWSARLHTAIALIDQLKSE